MKVPRLLLSFTLVAVCLSVVLLMNIPAWLKYKKGDVRDYNLAQAGELQVGDLVKGTVNMTLGPCAEEYKTKYGVRTSDKSSKIYYVLWMDCNQLIVYETGNTEEYQTLDKLMNETDNYFESLAEARELDDMSVVTLPTTSMPIEGRVTELPDQVRTHFKRLYDNVFGDEEFASETEPVMITRIKLDSLTTQVLIGAGVGVLALGLLIATIVVWRRSKKYGY